jgi:peroxiredoxin
MRLPLPANLRTAGLAAASLLVAVLVWGRYRLLVERGRHLLRQPDAGPVAESVAPGGLPVGAFLSDFALPTRNGEIVTLPDLLARRLLLLFVQPGCLFSRTLAREMQGVSVSVDAPRPVLIVSGEVNDPESLALVAGVPGLVLFDPHGQVARLMRVTATPSGYLVDEHRRTLGPRLEGPTALLGAARGDSIENPVALPPTVTPILRKSALPSPLLTGAKAPPFSLPVLTGGDWSLQEHRGQPLALIFSDPECPPCATLLHELARRNTTGVVVISRGDPGENARLAAASGLTLPQLLQQSREVARIFGTLETPAAYIIDETGAIAAGPGIGTEEVLTLIALKGRKRELAEWAHPASAIVQDR